MYRKQIAPIPRSGLFVALAVLGLLGSGYILVTALSPKIEEIPYIRQHRQMMVQKQLQSDPITQNRLYIPKIGVSIAVVTGDDESALLRGAWHRQPQNGNPKDGGNFVLSAHRFDMGYTPAGTLKKSPFYHIDEVKLGDPISVDYEKVRYTYRVSKIYKVKPNATEIERRTEHPTLTLYSCTLRGSADGRDVIEAVKAAS